MEISIAADDRTPVSELPKRYGIGRTQLYERRLTAMAEAGLGEPVRIQNKSFVSSEQLRFLDSLHEWVQQNGSDVDRFLSERYGTKSNDGQSLATTDTTQAESKESMLLGLLSAIVQRNPANTLTNFDELEKAAMNRWRLPTNKLAALLELHTIKGDSIERYGFRCTRMQSKGKQSEWLIEKLD
ncbi:hypothetical protein [Leptolyngbya sp. FACHB-17]|uniref:hypothetical protein n=1 Tax=unclassified Leptolyngbya TaxID=2650499 RepID=UPI001680111C|nr:hypothetical protein [Leptolyngbya sp. FACHB-17]MBD2083363.1 hypothetical protein [Leptolyngbya sp. FACHB-17]